VATRGKVVQHFRVGGSDVGGLELTVTSTTVLPGRYADSVRLLRVSEQLQKLPGILAAAVVMGTPMNLGLLLEEGYPKVEATADDLVVAIAGGDQSLVTSAEAKLESLLEPTRVATDRAERAARSVEWALVRNPGANVVIVGVPGGHAALEAWAAIRAGRNVFLFSDNVPIEDEVRLKRAAARLGLLVMGPDCGTAILGGVGLGFANRVRSGPIGLVGASGTGLQQVASLIHQGGSGIAAAIGTGSRDLSQEVGGIMTMLAIDRLASDENVRRIGLISKPADARVASAILDRLSSAGKPAVACLLGYETQRKGVSLVPTLTQAAEALLGMQSTVQPSKFNAQGQARSITEPAVMRLGGAMTPKGSRGGTDRPSRDGRLLGLFCGGTLCEEARRIAVDYGLSSARFVDLGGDEYTRGRAHPMIDPRLRASMLVESGGNADVLLFDVVLGDLAHSDPAGALTAALEELRRKNSDRPPPEMFASVIGTDLDPQGLDRQRSVLEASGVCVSASNEEAARWAVTAALAAAP